MRRVPHYIAIVLALLIGLTGLGTLVPAPHQALAATPTVRLSPTAGYVGDKVGVSISGFPKNRMVTVAWDGKTIATIQSSSTGNGTTSFKVPTARKGAHTVSAAAGSASAKASFTVNPKLRLSPSSVTVGSTLKVTLRGYAKGETISLALDTTSNVLTTVTASSTGSASLKIALRPTPGGRHKLIGRGTTGSQSSAWLTVVSSVALSPASGTAGISVRVTFRGFGKGERIEVQWLDARGSRSLGFATTSSTGSAGVTVTIPKAASGTYAIRAVGMSSFYVAQAPFEIT
jgi:hypothetical protein